MADSMTRTRQLKVLFLLAGDRSKASSRVRGYWIAEELEKLGHRCTLVVADKPSRLILAMKAIPVSDVVIFQKTFSRWHRRIQTAASSIGKTTLVDLDDWPSRSNNPSTLANAERMIARASVVVCGSRSLEEYAKRIQPNSIMIPSCIRLASYEFSGAGRNERLPNIGWIGNGAHYKADLCDILASPLAALASRQATRFSLIGACGEPELYRVFKSIPGLDVTMVDEIKWADSTAASEAISEFDIGVYPLHKNEFNRFKCGFKALEYMSMGVPVVASPVGSSNEIVDDGLDGFFADGSGAWVNRLGNVHNRELLRKMGDAARLKVRRAYSTEVSSKRLLQAIVQARSGPSA